MNNLTKKLLKSVKVNHGASFLDEENCLLNVDDKDYVKSDIPMLNVALSGDVNKGLSYGVTVFAGPSKHFKTSYGLELAKSFQKKYEEGVVIYFDSEFGSVDMLENFDLDKSRVMHVPVANIEELKFNMMSILEEIDKDEKVFFFVDSIGNLASKKEVEDAMNEKSVADMTRAKQVKSLFRMITPIVRLKKIYAYFVAHTYDTQEMFSKKVVSGGTGIMYSSDTVVIVGKSQDKEGKDLKGFTFTLNIDKSRTIKEKSKIPIVASYEHGIHKYSGLKDIAVECGIVEKVRKRSNMLVFGDMEIAEKDEAMNDEFWEKVLKESDLADILKKYYKLER